MTGPGGRPRLNAIVITSRTVGIFLERERPALPFREILQRWLAAGLEPDACRAVLDDVVRTHGLDPGLFDLSGFASGGMVATDALLFGVYDRPSDYVLTVRRTGHPDCAMGVARGELPAMFAALRAAATGDDPDDFRAEHGSRFTVEVLDALTAGPPARDLPRWDAAEAPGIYRREHASLLLRSRQAAVVVDPLALGVARFPDTLCGAPVNRSVAAVDAVLVTHTHGDHWHLPSILHVAGSADVPVVVPHVPRANILSFEAPVDVLSDGGQAAVALAWGDVLALGDMRVQALPFFGEQPARLAPGPPAGVRNWGNCYRVETPDYTAILLVDTGADPAGDMVRVVRQSVAQRGPVDVLLSCLQEFPSPFMVGVASECLTLPFARLRDLFRQVSAGRLPSSTAGPTGVLQLCRQADARTFLPYANGFTHLGRPNAVDWGAGASEAAIVGWLDAQLRVGGAVGRAVAWNPGDAALFDRGKLRLRPYAGGSG